VRKPGIWLAILAMALQATWPLLANAKPRSVALVPLCTVDGVTHYLELATGKTPLEDSLAHSEHCPLCFAGAGVSLAAALRPSAGPDQRAEELPRAERAIVSRSICNCPGARAPPVSLVVTANVHNFRRHDEKASIAGRAALGALYRSRVMRLGVLHS
jgi:Protein of unknown function (DUF2946)